MTTRTFRRAGDWLLRQSLWLGGVGLMLASSGIDGAYLVRIMPDGFGWLGYVLNTTSDAVSQVLMFWFGRLQMDRSSVKRKRAWWLLAAEAVLTGYAWFFGWRQLLLVLPRIEGSAAHWVAPVAAAFTPAGLVAIGYAQALLAGRIEAEKETRPAQAAAQGNGHAAHKCPYCGAEAGASGAPFASQQAVSAHLRYCAEYKTQTERRSAQAAAEAADV